MAYAHPPPRSPLDRHRQLAPNASIRVSPLCLGSMGFGEAWKDRMGECSKTQTFDILDYFFSQGGNFIDTANAYQNGQSETWLGEWVTEKKNRDQIVLATKYGSSFLGHAEHRTRFNTGGNGTKSLKLSLESSLERLQTTYIDVLYLHWWDYTVTIPELMVALNDLCTSGKVLYLGISDTPAWIVAKANQYARDHGLRQFVVYQGLWNAGVRDFEREIIPMCHDEGMGLIPYGTLGQGRFRSRASFTEREKANPGRKIGTYSQHDKNVSAVLERVAASKSVEITSVAMAYCMAKTPHVFPLVGCRTLEHLKGNIAALQVSLSKDEIKELDAAYLFDPGFPHTFLSGTAFNPAAAPASVSGPADVWLTKMMGNFDFVEAEKPIKPAQV